LAADVARRHYGGEPRLISLLGGLFGLRNARGCGFASIRLGLQ
jgi:hypothetical protein